MPSRSNRYGTASKRIPSTPISSQKCRTSKIAFPTAGLSKFKSGWIDLPLEALGVQSQQPYQVHDLLSDAHYLWHGARNYVELSPGSSPAHIFRIRKRLRTEQDFDYYL